MHLIIAVWVPANVSVTILRCTPLFDGTGQIHLRILCGMLFNLWFMGDLTRRIRIKMLSCVITSYSIHYTKLYDTDCEVSISPNCCVIDESKPHFLTVSDVLKKSVDNTLALLRLELEIHKNELQERNNFV